MPRRSEHDIVSVAGRLIGARGFDALSVADIASECGLSKQALLYHYRNKAAIKTAVVDFLVEHSNRVLLELVGTITGSPEERIEHTLQALDSGFKAVPWAAAVILRFLLDGDEEVIGRLREGTLAWVRYMSEELTRGARDGRFRELPDPVSTLEQVGMLMLTTFAVLPLRGWGGRPARQASNERLAELTRLIRVILLDGGASRVPARAGKPTHRRRSS